MPSAPVPPYWNWRRVIEMPALAGIGRLYSTLPAALFDASVSCRYPGITPRGGTGPLWDAGHWGICAAPTAGGAAAPVRHVLPCAVQLGSSTEAPVNVSCTTLVPPVGGSARTWTAGDTPTRPATMPTTASTMVARTRNDRFPTSTSRDGRKLVDDRTGTRRRPPSGDGSDLHAQDPVAPATCCRRDR